MQHPSNADKRLLLPMISTMLTTACTCAPGPIAVLLAKLVCPASATAAQSAKRGS